VLAVALCLMACQPPKSAPASSGSSPGAALPTTSPVATVTASPIPPSAPPAIGTIPFDRYEWQQASIPIEEQSFVLDVGSAPFGWVAVGVRVNFPGPDASFAPGEDPLAKLYSGVVWTSPDGLTWTRHPDGPEFDGSRMTKVVGTATGALAFGLAGICMPDACSGLPPNGGTIVWSSSDGDTWERLSATGLGDGATVDVTETDGALVAVGFIANAGSKPDNDSFSNPTDAAVWRSTDGRHWTAIDDLPVADELSQVSGQGASLVAIGSSNDTTVTWVSTDAGLTWKNGPALGDDCCLSSTATRGASMVNMSWLDAEPTVDGIARRADATSKAWTTVSPAVMHGYRPVSVQSLGASYVAFGWTSHSDADAGLVDDKARAYASLDGAKWARVDLPAGWDGLAPLAEAGSGRELVAILGPLDTFNGTPDRTVMTVWLGTAP
jgi:hypothetical protein